MKSGLLLGITCAIALHAAVIFFGGLVFEKHKADYASLQKVELLSEEKVDDKKKLEDPVEKREMEAQNEKAPDAAEIIDKLEAAPADNTPKLEAASLSAIEAALSGQGGGSGDFAGGMDFASGGRIGGTGKAGGDQGIDKAFSMSEIDQKPRAIFQAAPNYPTGMHNEEGVVVVIFIVDPTGRVTNLRIEKSSNPGFEKAATDAVKQWKFEPAVKAGQRVACKMRVPIRFQPRATS